MMARPYQKANVPGPEVGTTVYDAVTMANILKSPKKKVFVIGSESLDKNMTVDGMLIADLFVEIANKLNCSVVATGHVHKYLKDKIDNSRLKDMSLINITDRLSDPNWTGLDGKGQYAMAIFGGHLVYYVSQTLSRLKNFTNWLRTIDLDKYAHPNARFSLPNLSNTEWKEYLEKIIENL